MYRRSILMFTILVLALVPLLSTSRPAIGQDGSGFAAGFPEAITVQTLAAGEVGDVPTSPVLLNLERVLMPAGASSEPRQVATVEMVYVDRGALTIVDNFGLTSTLTEGNSVHLRAGAAYETRNDSPDEVSFLRLTPTAAVSSATPMASPVADEGTGNVSVTTLAQFALEEPPAAPATLFLIRATWDAGVDSGPYTQNGPIGMMVESGTLTISSPSGIDGQLGEGSAVLLPADQPLSTRNDGDSAAVALLFGIVPAGGEAVAPPSAPPATPPATPGVTGTPGSESTPTSGPDSIGTPPSSSSAPDAAAGTVLYHADTSGGLELWSGAGGWQTVSGMIVNDGTSDSPSFIAAPFEVLTADYAVEVEMQWARDGETFGVVARGGDEGGYWVGFAPSCEGPSDRHHLQLWVPPVETERCSQREDMWIAHTDVEPNSEWHTYRFEVQGNTIRVLLDGTVVIETSDNRYLTPGEVGLWSDGAQVSVRRFTVIALGDEG